MKSFLNSQFCSASSQSPLKEFVRISGLDNCLFDDFVDRNSSIVMEEVLFSVQNLVEISYVWPTDGSPVMDPLC